MTDAAHNQHSETRRASYRDVMLPDSNRSSFWTGELEPAIGLKARNLGAACPIPRSGIASDGTLTPGKWRTGRTRAYRSIDP
jgi:hypothetical protein